MRFIPTRVHGPADYLMGLLLIASPWIFDFADVGAAKWIPIILGAGVILYSLFTDYEWGFRRSMPMPVHLWLDGLGGLLLVISPWLFGFYVATWLPHVVLGVLEIGAALFTQTIPERARRRVLGSE